MVFMKVEPIVLKTGLDQLVRPPASDGSGPVWKEVEPGIELIEPAVRRPLSSTRSCHWSDVAPPTALRDSKTPPPHPLAVL